MSERLSSAILHIVLCASLLIASVVLTTTLARIM